MTGGWLVRNRALLPILIAASALAVLNGASWWALRISTRELESNFQRNLIAFSELLARQIEIAYREDLEDRLDQLESFEGSTLAPELSEWLGQAPEGFLNDLLPSTSSEGLFHDLYLLGRSGELIQTWSGEWILSSTRETGAPVPTIHPLLLGDREAILSALEDSVTRITPSEKAVGGFFSTAYSPVRFAGEVQGAVGVRADILFADRLAAIRKGLVFAAVFGSLLIVGLAVMLHRSLGRLEAAQRRMAHRERLAELGQMASVAAHEIRNPLGIIEQTADLVRRKYAGEGDDPLLGYISEEVDRLNRLVGRFLEFARPSDSPDDHGDILSCDLAGVTREVCGQLLPDAEKRSIRLTWDIPEGAVGVRGIDSERARQILLNLLLNAFEAVPAGLSVEVRVTTARGRAHLQIRDEGAGMTPDVLAKAVNPFFTTREKGSGLGLALVAKMVEEAGGNLEIQSSPGEGTVVTISLNHSA